MLDDWNMNDALPFEERTYVRIKPWDTDEELHILAKSVGTSDGMRVVLSEKAIEGAYVLDGTNPPEGYTEIRLVEGNRWLVRTADIEIVPSREIAMKKLLEEWAKEDQQVTLENVVLALETPEVQRILSNMVRQLVIKHMNAEKTRNEFLYK